MGIKVALREMFERNPMFRRFRKLARDLGIVPNTSRKAQAVYAVAEDSSEPDETTQDIARSDASPNDCSVELHQTSENRDGKPALQEEKDDPANNENEVELTAHDIEPNGEHQNGGGGGLQQKARLLAQPETDVGRDLNNEEIMKHRHDAWVYFFADHVDCYTEGPCRLVDAWDGVGEYASLLMTHDLSQKIQTQIHFQRLLVKHEALAARKTCASDKFRTAVKAEIRSHKSRIACMEAKNGSTNAIKEDEQELQVLERVLETAEIEQRILEGQIEDRKKTVLHYTAQVNAFIEEAFITANLIQPEMEEPEEVVEEKNIEDEYQKMREEMYGTGDEGVTPRSLNTCQEYLYGKPVVLTPEQQARDDLLDKLYHARKRLDGAQWNFDSKKEMRQEEIELNKEAELRAEPTTDASVEDFDRRWLVRFQEITHELVVAEEEYRQIKTEAAEAGVVELDDGRSSCFIDDEDDDSQLSVDEEEIKKAKEGPRIGDWLNDISHNGQHDSDEEVKDKDEWEAAEVEICDSVSAVEIGAVRRRIDKWRRQFKSEP